MTALLGIAMVVSGAACFGCAVVARRRLGIAAAAVMLIAMLDLALWQLVPPLVWAGALAAVGIALGVTLRPHRLSAQSGAHIGPLRVSSAARPWSLGRATALALTLAYLSMAWLVFTHAADVPAAASGATLDQHGTATNGAATHGATAQEGGLFGFGIAALPLTLALALAAVLAVASLVALRRRRRILALEAGGMAVMLGAMLLAH